MISEIGYALLIPLIPHALYGLGYQSASSKYVYIFCWSNYKLEEKGTREEPGRFPIIDVHLAAGAAAFQEGRQGSNQKFNNVETRMDNR